MYAGMYTRRLYIQGGAAGKGGQRQQQRATARRVGYASPLEGNKGGATREIKGAPNGRRAPRLRHVFLDNLFGNINHREHRETRALVERGRRRGKSLPTIAIFAILCERFGVYRVRTKEKNKISHARIINIIIKQKRQARQ